MKKGRLKEQGVRATWPFVVGFKLFSITSLSSLKCLASFTSPKNITVQGVPWWCSPSQVTNPTPTPHPREKEYNSAILV